VHAAGEKRIRKPDGKVIIDDFDLCVVKGTLVGLSHCKEVRSTWTKFLPVGGRVNISWREQLAYLKTIVHKTGFR
jgi:hypothetical protein